MHCNAGDDKDLGDELTSAINSPLTATMHCDAGDDEDLDDDLRSEEHSDLVMQQLTEVHIIHIIIIIIFIKTNLNASHLR